MARTSELTQDLVNDAADQLQAQLKEKDSQLKQAEKREASLQATIADFSKKD